MDFSLNDEQQMLLDTTRRFVARDYDFDVRRKIVASEAGWSRATWTAMAELGLLAVDVSEADGGIGAGPVGVMLVAQAVGEGLLVEPFIASAVVASAAIARLGSVEQRAEWLPALASGDRIAVLAVDEDALLDTSVIDVRARADGEGWTLDGNVRCVYHAPAVDLLLVAAHIDAGIGVFAVAASAVGVTRNDIVTVDGQRAAHLSFEGVTADARLGDGDATAALQAVLDRGLAALCADAFGVLDRILKATIEYSRQRVQFGAPIGSFQALQHRMADMLMLVEQARSMLYLATAHCLDDDEVARRRTLSGAKVLIGQAARRVGQEAVQLHGGMGMTDELDVSHCFKRLLAFELRFGTTEAHLVAYRRLPAD
jgi:alkylation response protein AidB-like acyl-CoA dehydrogenase